MVQPERSVGAAKQPLILGSSSRYRAELLQRLGVKFSQISPNVDETPRPDELPADLVLRLAAAKAAAIAEREPEALIIASDQVASIDDQILGKPGTPERAVGQLRQLSSRQVTFYTSLQVFNAATGAAQSELDITEVQFRTLSDSEIAYYVATESPLDCAGAFKSEGLGLALFEQVRSTDPSALIGLPLIKLCAALRSFDYGVLGDA